MLPPKATNFFRHCPSDKKPRTEIRFLDEPSSSGRGSAGAGTAPFYSDAACGLVDDDRYWPVSSHFAIQINISSHGIDKLALANNIAYDLLKRFLTIINAH